MSNPRIPKPPRDRIRPRPCFSVSGASYIKLRSGAWKRGISVARLVDKGINDAIDRLEQECALDNVANLEIKHSKVMSRT